MPDTKTIITRATTLPALAGLALLILAGCSGEQWRQAGQQAGTNYQCHQENANRPDSAQRQAECNQRAPRQTDRDQPAEDGR